MALGFLAIEEDRPRGDRVPRAGAEAHAALDPRAQQPGRRVRGAREWAKALETYERAFEIAPPTPEAAAAAAWILATGQDESLIDGARALELATYAVQRQAPDAFEILAASHARVSDFDAAVTAQEQAIQGARTPQQRRVPRGAPRALPRGSAVHESAMKGRAPEEPRARTRARRRRLRALRTDRAARLRQLRRRRSTSRGTRHVRRGLLGRDRALGVDEYYSANWHPLTWMSHMARLRALRARAGGTMQPASFSALNTAVLPLRAAPDDARRGGGGRGPLRRPPARVESVAWVSERKDVLASAFFCS